MTPKQQRFVEEFCIDFNGSSAARRAGYATSVCAQQAYENLRKPEIRAAIDARLAHLCADAEISSGRTLLELKRIGYYDVRRVFDGGNLKLPTQLDDETAAAIREIEVVTRNLGEGEVEYVNKVKFHDKVPALIKLAERTGALKPDLVKAPEEGIRRVIFEYEDEHAPSNKTGV